MKTASEIRQQAEEHWEWIEQVLKNRETETRHMFIEGFIHGYKHGKEEVEKR